MAKEWQIRPEPVVSTSLREAVGGHPLVARILAQRGMDTAETALPFLDAGLYAPMSPWELPGMARAVDVLQAAIRQGTRICVWGDYDADGMTATALLSEALASMGARVDYGVPRRAEGHGVPERAITEARDEGCGLLLTCDTGITDAEVLAGALESFPVIVTDHHDLPERLPDAQAIVNPKMLAAGHPLRHLTGVGVAYLLVAALSERVAASADSLDRHLDLVALGTVADVATLTADVRYLVQRGLVVLQSTARPGLRALAAGAGLDLAHVDAEDVGYALAPRLNAAGRLDDARMGVELLLTSSEDEADRLAGELERLNQDRRAHTESAMAVAQDALARDPEAVRAPVIFVEGRNWKAGILGLVAGRLANQYDRPALVFAHQADGVTVASARSVEGIDIHKAIRTQSDLLLREGGHPMAAGCSMASQSVSVFKSRLAAHLQQAMSERKAPVLEIDAFAPWPEITLDLAHDLTRLAPFGAGNPRPVLALSDVTLVRTADVSTRKQTRHRHLFVSRGTEDTLRLTWFNAGVLPPVNEALDIAFGMRAGRWRGRERLELDLFDWRFAQAAREAPSVDAVEGLSVVDWRERSSLEEAERELERMYGQQLAVWGEGAGRSQRSVSRVDLPAGVISALAIATAPPGPEELLSVMDATSPNVVYLLPAKKVPEVSAAILVRQVGAMLRVALRQRGGALDIARMAARLGVREAAVRAALRGLEEAGTIALTVGEHGAIRAERASGSRQRITIDDSSHRQAHVNDVQSPKAVLAHLVDETAAFRRAYHERPWVTFMPRRRQAR